MFPLACVCLLGVWSAAGVRVETPLGPVDGGLLTSRSGRPYNYFTNLPYAQPPIAHLRFKSPQPVKPWTNAIDGTSVMPRMCTQRQLYVPKFRGRVVGEEDCLYLNVYSPNVDPKAKLPVLVYIHGGGWGEGFSGPATYYKNFMDEDVVLVGITYRLGILGFLSTEDLVIPGNFGLKDQSLALKWIRENIQSFGGDPNSVTIFGESAGGASVHFHMMSPLSKGLADRFISQSGDAHALWANSPPGNHLASAYKLANLTSCPESPHEQLLQCLLKIDAKELMTLTKEFIEWDIVPPVAFPPVIEPEWEGAFMTQSPLKIKTNQPWIVGFTRDEGRILTAGLLNEPESVTEEFVARFDELLPSIASYKGKTTREQEVTDIMRTAFFPQTDRVSTLNGFRKLFLDLYFKCPALTGVKNHKGEVYFYFFDYLGEFSLADMSGPRLDENPGACHADELVYLFSWKEINPYKDVAEDDELSKTMVKMWTNFGRYGKPTTLDQSFSWERMGAARKEFLHIGGPGKMAAGPAATWDEWYASCKAWKKVPMWEYLNKKQAVKEEL